MTPRRIRHWREHGRDPGEDRRGGSRAEDITLFSNIPTPYNADLLAALRAEGAEVHAVFAHTPAQEGRAWRVDLGEGDVVTDSWWRETAAWRVARGTDVILSGGYAAPTDLARRLATARRRPRTRREPGAGAPLPAERHPDTTVHFWGERLAPRGPAVRALRHLTFRALPLDGILAVGSRAAATYRSVVGPRVPVHVFPYVTSSGLSTARSMAADPTIGFSGRLVPYKGVDLVLRALATVAPRQRPRFEVAGDGPEMATLRAMARQLGVDVHWLGDLAPATLTRVRSMWWAQVVPSRRSEGWGVVVHEALNSGVPVLASAHVNAAHDLVRPGFDGTIIAEARALDPAAWAEAIGHACDPDVSEDQGRAARRVGAAFAPAHAAPWLLSLLADARRVAAPDEAERSEAEAAAAGRRSGRAGLGRARGRARSRPNPVPPRSFVRDTWARLDGAP